MKKVMLVVLTMIFFGPFSVFAEDNIEDLYKKIAPDGKAVVKSITPKDDVESETLLTTIFQRKLENEDYEVFAICKPENLNSCYVKIWPKNDYTGLEGGRDITVTYENPSDKDLNNVKNILSKLPQKVVDDGYKLEDLSILNYYLTLKDTDEYPNTNIAIKFSTINNLIKGANISFEYYDVMGTKNLSGLGFFSRGYVSVYYKGFACGTGYVRVDSNNIIYISQDTENTKEAYINAAQKRINDYFGDSKTAIVSYGGLLSTLNSDDLVEWVNINDTDGNYYNIKIGTKTYKFYIMKGNDSKLNQPVYIGTNLENDIIVQSVASAIPLDTQVNVINVKNQQIEQVVKTNNYVAYDITLHADSTNANITKLSSGDFLIQIPVSSELEGKDLTVYYIPTNDDTPEQFEVTVKDGYASFRTNHFSIYALSEKNNDDDVDDNVENTDQPSSDDIDKPIENPKTGMISIVSLIVIGSIGGISLYLSNKKNKVHKI